MARRRRLIVANWKMYGRLTSGLTLAKDLADKAEASRPDNVDVVLCPPATLLWAINESIQGSPVMLGAQDCHFATHGAFTGDLSAAMFADIGCRYVIVGHSERRGMHGEDDNLVARKVEAAQAAGLTAILCVGETAQQLQSGSAADIIATQLRGSLPEKYKKTQLVVAYEPVWAIGTGQQPDPHDVSEIGKVIRQTLGVAGETVQILYGGSVAPLNVGPMLAVPEIDGVLVGSASLNADGFWAIVEAAGR